MEAIVLLRSLSGICDLGELKEEGMLLVVVAVYLM